MKKAVIISSLFILIIILLMVDWGKKPKEWIIGQWYEPNRHAFAEVTPDTVTVQYMGRTREFNYELLEKEGEVVVWTYDRDRDAYYGLFEFKGRDKVKVRAKPNANPRLGGYTNMVESMSSSWDRVKE